MANIIDLASKQHVISVTTSPVTQQTFHNAYSLNCAHKVEEFVAQDRFANRGRCPVQTCRAEIKAIKRDTDFQEAVNTLNTIYNRLLTLLGDPSAKEIGEADFSKLGKDHVEKVISCSVSTEPFSQAHSLNCAHKIEKIYAEQILALKDVFPNNGNVCPLCRETITVITPDTQFQEVIKTIIDLHNKLTAITGEEALEATPTPPALQAGSARTISQTDAPNQPQVRNVAPRLNPIPPIRTLGTGFMSGHNETMRQHAIEMQRHAAEMRRFDDEMRRHAAEMSRHAAAMGGQDWATPIMRGAIRASGVTTSIGEVVTSHMSHVAVSGNATLFSFGGTPARSNTVANANTPTDIKMEAFSLEQIPQTVSGAFRMSRFQVLEVTYENHFVKVSSNRTILSHNLPDNIYQQVKNFLDQGR